LSEGWIDQEKERFVLGPGRDTNGDTFIGIWDRTVPAMPMRRFSDDEKERALSTYLELRSGTRGADSQPGD
jgi:hypothetical protein